MTTDPVRHVFAATTIHEEVLSRFDTHVSQLRTALEIGAFLLSYGAFSHTFAGGALCLAGETHLASSAFGEVGASEIAAQVLAAAEDEFLDKASQERITHRRLWHGLKHAITCYLHATDNVTPMRLVSYATLEHLAQRIERTYARPAIGNDRELVAALGFHLGSEYGGAHEFATIDQHLRLRHLALVEHLERTPCTETCDSYAWIRLHTRLEVEHARAAQNAVRQAFTYYRGQVGESDRRDALHQGFAAFFQTLDAFVTAHRSEP